jgi:hypothetical protein
MRTGLDDWNIRFVLVLQRQWRERRRRSEFVQQFRFDKRLEFVERYGRKRR